MLLTQHNHSSSLFVLYNTTSWTILSSHLSVSHTFCLFLFLSLSLPLGHSNLTKLQLTAWPPELADTQRQRQMTVMIYSGSRVLQRWRIWGSCQRKKKETKVTEIVTFCSSTEASTTSQNLRQCTETFVLFSCHRQQPFWQNSRENKCYVMSAQTDGAALPTLKTHRKAHSVFWVNKCTSTTKQPQRLYSQKSTCTSVLLTIK